MVCPVADLGQGPQIQSRPLNEKPGVIAGLLASTNRLNNGVIERRLCRAVCSKCNIGTGTHSQQCRNVERLGEAKN